MIQTDNTKVWLKQTVNCYICQKQNIIKKEVNLLVWGLGGGDGKQSGYFLQFIRILDFICKNGPILKKLRAKLCYSYAEAMRGPMVHSDWAEELVT